MRGAERAISAARRAITAGRILPRGSVFSVIRLPPSLRRTASGIWIG
jgi:hypothetical protein